MVFIYFYSQFELLRIVSTKRRLSSNSLYDTPLQVSTISSYKNLRTINIQDSKTKNAWVNKLITL